MWLLSPQWYLHLVGLITRSFSGHGFHLVPSEQDCLETLLKLALG